MRAATVLAVFACGGGQSAAPAPAPVVANTAPEAESPPPAATQPPRRPTEPACEVRDATDIPCALDWMDFYADQSCACTDAACHQYVQNRMVAWLSTLESSIPDAKPTKAEDERADRINDRLRACAEKLEASP